MSQLGAALFYYKLGQRLLQVGAALLLQNGASVVTNWVSYYKLRQPLLQNRPAITNWGKTYYKLGQVLQIRAVVKNWGITDIHVNGNDKTLPVIYWLPKIHKTPIGQYLLQLLKLTVVNNYLILFQKCL